MITFLEVILGIDNIVFMNIAVQKLPIQKQSKIMTIGLVIASLIRIGLLFVLSFILGLNKPLFSLSEYQFSIKDLILLFGGAFLIYKSTTEIFHNSESKKEDKKTKDSIVMVLLQIIVINFVFSFDSILTAIGLTKNIMIMISSVIVSTGVMLIFSKYIRNFILKYKSVKMLALAFIMMVGLFLVLDAFHIDIPKGYIYVTIGFSLFVEFLNIKFKSRK